MIKTIQNAEKNSIFYLSLHFTMKYNDSNPSKNVIFRIVMWLHTLSMI